MSFLVDRKYIDMVSGSLNKFSWTSSKTASCRCPICGDSKKNLNKKRGYLYEREGNFYYKCHNCGISYTFKKFLEIMDSHLYSEYLLEKYKNNSNHTTLNFKAKPNLDYNKIYRENKLNKIKEEFLKFATPCSELSDLHFCKEYLTNRKIPSELFHNLYFTDDFKKFSDYFGIVETKLQEKEQRLIIPFFDENNELICFQGRSFSDSGNRYITIKVKNDNKIFGMNNVDKNKIVYILEGPIDSLFVNNAIAIAGSEFSSVITNFNFEFVCVLDNQPRNKEVVDNYFRLIGDGYKVVIWNESFSDKKDVNAMILTGKSKEDIMNYITNNTFSGLRARVEFNKWRKI